MVGSKSIISPTTSSPPAGTILEEEEEEEGTKLATFPGVGVGVVATPPMEATTFSSISSPFPDKSKKTDKSSRGSMGSVESLGGSGNVGVFHPPHEEEDGSGDAGGSGSPEAIGGRAMSPPPASFSQKGMSLRDRLAGKTVTATTVTTNGTTTTTTTTTTGTTIHGALSASGKETITPIFGNPSRKIESAAFLSNHVVVFGSPLNIETFVAEIRRPVISLLCYRPILYVGLVVPEKWEHLTKTYDDVYWLSGEWWWIVLSVHSIHTSSYQHQH